MDQQETEKNVQEELNPMVEAFKKAFIAFGIRLGKALLAALLTILFFILVLPWKLWTYAIRNLGDKGTIETFGSVFKTDVPLMNSWIIFWNAVIVVAPIFILVAGFYQTIDLPSYYTWEILKYTFLAAYFSPMYLTLIKEFLYLPISIANNIKEISKK